MYRKVICALDTGDLDVALNIASRIGPKIGAFKIGHALTLRHGLDVIPRLQEAGASRVFLDLKFHDIPNSVALAVREAARHNVWMMTLHIAGGPAMVTAAVEEAKNAGENAPLLVGVSVLTSIDQGMLTDFMGVDRPLLDYMVYLSKHGVDCGLDGVVCSPNEIAAIRGWVGPSAVIVTPGIRLGASTDDQKRVGSPTQALEDGADYLVVGRALIDAPDVDQALASLGISEA